MSSNRPWPPQLEAPGEFLGRLQRGLGLAAQEVLDGRIGDAGELIVSCMQVDPRWMGRLIIALTTTPYLRSLLG